MSIYPCRQDIRPVDHATDPNITPTQMIAHVAVAQTKGSGPAYSGSLDWHFYVAHGWPGCKPEEIVTQLRDTNIEADANYWANKRAISFESAGTGEDEWDEYQVDAIIWLFRKGNEIDKIPLELCPAWDKPGIGYHRLFNEWNKPYHSCPGDKKVFQFRNIILPALTTPPPIITQEEDMTFICEFLDWPTKLWLVTVDASIPTPPGSPNPVYGTRKWIPDPKFIWALQGEQKVKRLDKPVSGGRLFAEIQ